MPAVRVLAQVKQNQLYGTHPVVLSRKLDNGYYTA